MFKQYLQVTKPGIIFGNLISVIGGFLLASKGHIDYPLFIWTLLGVSLVVASGCVFNNYIDRDIDRKMERTKNRVLVKGLISPEASLVYATLLGIAGFMLLWFGANPLACWLGVMGFVVYVGVYSLYMKRHSVYGTLIGSLSGAAPPVIGYCAVTGDFDSGAAILLAIFSLWQMPHSYAIAIFRFKDYQAANIPVSAGSERHFCGEKPYHRLHHRFRRCDPDALSGRLRRIQISGCRCGSERLVARNGAARLQSGG